MKVLFDVSILGVGHAYMNSRAGIFRVVENIALGLQNSAACSLTLCASQKNFIDCKEYLRANQPFHGAEFSLPVNLFSSVYNLVEPLRTEIAKLPRKPWKTPLRKAYRYGEQFVNPLNSRDIRTADIYHSPVHPIPVQVAHNASIKKFITIHDLIPLVCPDHRSPSCVVSMKRILASINPDTFIFCVSHATKNDLLNYMPFLDKERIAVAHLAAGRHFYPCTDVKAIEAARQKYAIPAEGNYLLALSTLQPRKNFKRIIKCFIKMLREEHINDLKLVLVGANGWEYEEIYAEIDNAAGLKDRIITTGFVPDEDLASLYSGAMAFVYPSLYEGFGLPPLEAMQCGTPVITSNNSSIPEVVGDAAITIDPRDDDALCQALLAIYSSADLRQQLARQSVAKAREFSWEKTVEQTLAAYNKALDF